MVAEVFAAFLKLGVTSFGGPVAHVSYFRREFVERRRWLDEAQFARLLALCQFLPGPASSQLGFSLGLLRAGWPGALAAFAAFTLPSALLLFAFAVALPELTHPLAQAAIHGLKLAAVAVVAQAVVGMARQLCPDVPRASIAIVAAGLVLALHVAWAQLLVIGLGAIAGLALSRIVAPVPGTGLRLRYGVRTGAVLLVVFGLLLVVLPWAGHGKGGALEMASAFYRAGALVFGGGHVVLPLLQEAVVAPGWVSREEFLAGYGAAQAIPGPLFAFSAFLGARISMGHPVLGAALALFSVFLPGLLLVAGSLPFFHGLAERPGAARAVAGVNAAVVGLLAAALYDPVWTGSIGSPLDAAIAGVAFAGLVALRASPLLAAAGCVLAAMGAATLG